MRTRSGVRRSRSFFEHLESRQMLSADPAALRAAGFAPITWNGQETYVKPGEWVLDVNGVNGPAKGQLAAVNALLGKAIKDVKATRHLGEDGLVQISAPEGLEYEQLRGAAERLPGFAMLRPVVALWQQATTPNDLHANLWGLHNAGQTVPSSTSGVNDSGLADADTDAPEAWDLTTGESRTVVAGIDSGIDYTHPDLYRNIWINQGEIPAAVRDNLTDVDGDARITFWDLNESVNQGVGKITDLNGTGYIDGGDLLNDASGWEDFAAGVDGTPAGVDNDGNGHANDLVGWDVFNNDNDPADDQTHGTHTAGTIGATGNNGTGITGVNWRVQMMPVKVLGQDGSTTDTVAADGIRYAARNGANVSNNSYGGTGGAPGDPMDLAIAYAETRNHLFVAASGNGDWMGRGINNDAQPFSAQQVPASYDRPNIIAVGATDNNDQLASFSNYGATTVDLAAPGVSIYSTVPVSKGSYRVADGTSMAAPHVAGVAALAYGLRPGAAYAEVRTAVLTGVDAKSGLDGKFATGGRLNAFGTLGKMNPSAPATPAGVSASPASATRVTLRWSDVTGEAGYAVQRSTDPNFNPDVAAVASFTLGANTGSFVDSGLQPTTTYHYRVMATHGVLGDSAWSEPATATTPEAQRPGTPSDVAATPLSHTEVNVTWTDNSADEVGFKVQRSTSASFASSVEVSAPAGATAYRDAGLTAGATYYYRVVAVNASADSLPSDTASATTIPAAPVGTGTGLRGDYYDNMLTENNTAGNTHLYTLSGWKMARTDPTINFAWGTGSPSPSGGTKIAADTFTVEWNGMVEPRYTDNYVFRFEPDDGVGMWISLDGGQTMTPLWTPTWDRLDGKTGNGTSSEYANTSPYESDDNPAVPKLSLTAGVKYPVKIVYYEYSGGASARLRWRGEKAQPDEIVPQSQLYYAPTALTATAASATQVNLTWADNSRGETGFKVERSTNGSTWTQIAATTGGNATGTASYSATGLAAGTTYYFRVRAYTGTPAFNSAYSNTAIGRPAATSTATVSSASVVPLASSSATATSRGDGGLWDLLEGGDDDEGALASA